MLAAQNRQAVSTNSHLGIGGWEIFNRDGGGVDVDRQDERSAPEGTQHVIVDADVGMGAFTVHHNDDKGFNGSPGNKACA